MQFVSRKQAERDLANIEDASFWEKPLPTGCANLRYDLIVEGS
jgi:hypothetical protein